MGSLVLSLISVDLFHISLHFIGYWLLVSVLHKEETIKDEIRHLDDRDQIYTKELDALKNQKVG